MKRTLIRTRRVWSWLQTCLGLAVIVLTWHNLSSFISLSGFYESRRHLKHVPAKSNAPPKMPDVTQKIPEVEESIILENMLKSIESKQNRALKHLTSIVQLQLKSLQENCNGYTLLCGQASGRSVVEQACGLVCHIQQRITCLAISYAMQIPLIYDERTGTEWPYAGHWRSAFRPFGSDCEENSETIRVTWESNGPVLSRHPANCSHPCERLETVPFPLRYGFVVPRLIGTAVAKLHKNPFLWWTGQFGKYTTRLTNGQDELLRAAKRSVGLEKNHPTFGFYVEGADEGVRKGYALYFQAMKEVSFNSISRVSKTKKECTIFIASDDKNMDFQEVRLAYPDRSIIGFSTKNIFSTERDGRSSLDKAINELLILAESEFIICKLSSDVCRLLLELISVRYGNPTARLKSVGGSYSYQLHRIGNVPNNVTFQ